MTVPLRQSRFARPASPGDFHTLLDGIPYLPEETWDDPERRRAADIPDEIVYRPKWFIGLEMIWRAQANGIRFAWLTFDEGYGGKPPFLRELETMGQNYVAEIPCDTVGWTQPPEVHYQDHARDRQQGRSSRRAKLKVRNTPAVEVRNIGHNAGAYSPGPPQPLEDGPTGFTGERHHPGKPAHLLLAAGIAL